MEGKQPDIFDFFADYINQGFKQLNTIPRENSIVLLDQIISNHLEIMEGIVNSPNATQDMRDLYLIAKTALNLIDDELAENVNNVRLLGWRGGKRGRRQTHKLRGGGGGEGGPNKPPSGQIVSKEVAYTLENARLAAAKAVRAQAEAIYTMAEEGKQAAVHGSRKAKAERAVSSLSTVAGLLALTTAIGLGGLAGKEVASKSVDGIVYYGGTAGSMIWEYTVGWLRVFSPAYMIPNSQKIINMLVPYNQPFVEEEHEEFYNHLAPPPSGRNPLDPADVRVEINEAEQGVRDAVSVFWSDPKAQGQQGIQVRISGLEEAAKTALATAEGQVCSRATPRSIPFRGNIFGCQPLDAAAREAKDKKDKITAAKKGIRQEITPDAEPDDYFQLFNHVASALEWTNPNELSVQEGDAFAIRNIAGAFKGKECLGVPEGEGQFRPELLRYDDGKDAAIQKCNAAIDGAAKVDPESLAGKAAGVLKAAAKHQVLVRVKAQVDAHNLQVAGEQAAKGVQEEISIIKGDHDNLEDMCNKRIVDVNKAKKKLIPDANDYELKKNNLELQLKAWEETKKILNKMKKNGVKVPPKSKPIKQQSFLAELFAYIEAFVKDNENVVLYPKRELNHQISARNWANSPQVNLWGGLLGATSIVATLGAMKVLMWAFGGPYMITAEYFRGTWLGLRNSNTVKEANGEIIKTIANVARVTAPTNPIAAVAAMQAAQTLGSSAPGTLEELSRVVGTPPKLAKMASAAGPPSAAKPALAAAAAPATASEHLTLPTPPDGNCFFTAIFRSASARGILVELAACLGIDAGTEDDFIRTFRAKVASYIRDGNEITSGFYTDLQESASSDPGRYKLTFVGLPEWLQLILEPDINVKHLGGNSYELTDRSKAISDPTGIEISGMELKTFRNHLAINIQRDKQWVGQHEVEIVKDMLARCNVIIKIFNNKRKTDVILKARSIDQKPILNLFNDGELHYEYFQMPIPTQENLVRVKSLVAAAAAMAPAVSRAAAAMAPAAAAMTPAAAAMAPAAAAMTPAAAAMAPAVSRAAEPLSLVGTFSPGFRPGFKPKLDIPSKAAAPSAALSARPAAAAAGPAPAPAGPAPAPAGPAPAPAGPAPAPASAALHQQPQPVQQQPQRPPAALSARPPAVRLRIASTKPPAPASAAPANGLATQPASPAPRRRTRRRQNRRARRARRATRKY